MAGPLEKGRLSGNARAFEMLAAKQARHYQSAGACHGFTQRMLTFVRASLLRASATFRRSPLTSAGQPYHFLVLLLPLMGPMGWSHEGI
jgi:hypothetical protein